MSWILGVLGGFVLFAYGIVPTFQPSQFHRIYAAYGGIFIVMALLWGWTFQGTRPKFNLRFLEDRLNFGNCLKPAEPYFGHFGLFSKC